MYRVGRAAGARGGGCLPVAARQARGLAGRGSACPHPEGEQV